MYTSSGPFLPAVELLLEKGAEVDLQGTYEGFTALMTAASEGLVDIVRVLLEHGADPSLVDKDGDTAASFAQQNGHAEVVALLQSPPAQ
jgi:ankyrin repeat protein